MNLAILILIGMLTGWVASVIWNQQVVRDIVFNAFVGIAGSLLAGLIAMPIGSEALTAANSMSIVTIIASVIGAISMVALIELIKQSAMR